jgi:hypothetical protein
LIQDRPDPLTSSPDPGDDKPVLIPLSTAEKCVFALENCPRYRQKSISNQFLECHPTEPGDSGNRVHFGVPATDRQRNSAARLGLAEFGT